MLDYYVLEDAKRKGLLVRQDTRNLEEMFYNVSTSQWEDCDFLLEYMDMENENFGQYTQISDKEAVVYLNRLMFMKFYDDGFAYPDL
ncbi:hypothetical protein SAMN02745116_02251 [Pilibacter termitis]|uniref:Uncharacterized protein n=1 Tax=Pilibacter termitis TaxID=263852 RepID=A0A1T4QN22_9ENTE|nr:hypothetical protein [Pilibacter termitis]SKA05017.1 hypothetical protein SAMN02745116_02251 [Pilibacter termitis]